MAAAAAAVAAVVFDAGSACCWLRPVGRRSPNDSQQPIRMVGGAACRGPWGGDNIAAVLSNEREAREARSLRHRRRRDCRAGLSPRNDGVIQKKLGCVGGYGMYARNPSVGGGADTHTQTLEEQ
jgi:hypothetical protein